MKNPQLIIYDRDLLMVLRQIIAEFELKSIYNTDVRVMVKFNLITLQLKLERLVYSQQIKNKKLTIKLNELAALRICFEGSGLKKRAEFEPYLWPIYNQVMINLSQHISSC